MLIRQTLLYLPAQLLPALAQFVALLLWSHFASPDVIGIVTLFVSIQEFLVLGFMGFWTSYTVRFASKAADSAEAEQRMRRTSSVVVVGSAILQTIAAIILYHIVVDHDPRLYLIPILALAMFGRALNSFQAERGRARGDILLYSIEVMAGPVIGLAIGLVLLTMFGSNELWIFGGYAAAQLAAVLAGLVRDRGWLAFGRPDGAIVRHALSYGLPLIVTAIFVWVSQNTPRLLVSQYFGLAAAGIYALGFGLGFRVAVIAAMSVTAAAFPLAVRQANAGDDVGAMRQLSANATLLVAVLASTTIGLALVSGDVIGLFVAAPLRDSIYPVMLWSLLAGSIVCFRQHFLHQVFLLKNNTKPLGLISMAEAGIAVILGLLIVPHWGAVGGVISLTATSSLSMVTVFVLAVRQGLRPPLRDFMAIALAAAAMAVMVSAIPQAQTMAQLAVRIMAGGLVFCAVLAVLYGRPLMRLLKNRVIAKQATSSGVQPHMASPNVSRKIAHHPPIHDTLKIIRSDRTGSQSGSGNVTI